MGNKWNRGIAFIAEGETERQFCEALLLHYAKRHPECSVMLSQDENGEQCYELSGAFGSRVVRFNNVGTITQIHNSGSWFRNVCFSKASSCPWTVFLCYDTDAYDADTTKFHKGDWKLFRKSLLKLGDIKIIDLTAKADIEDIMLLDLHGISVYMNATLTSRRKTFRPEGKAPRA